jgi:hypothetical protein
VVLREKLVRTEGVSLTATRWVVVDGDLVMCRNDRRDQTRKALINGSATAVRALLFCFGLPLFFALASVGAQAVSVDGLRPVVRQLKKVVRMPAFLPTSVPSSITATRIFARVHNATFHAYTVQLASTRSCTTAPSCLLGAVAAERGRTPSMLGRAVKLANGTAAYYHAPILSWRRESVWYRLRLPDVALDSSEAVAASFRKF